MIDQVMIDPAQDKNQLKSLVTATSYCFILRCMVCH